MGEKNLSDIFYSDICSLNFENVDKTSSVFYTAHSEISNQTTSDLNDFLTIYTPRSIEPLEEWPFLNIKNEASNIEDDIEESVLNESVISIPNFNTNISMVQNTPTKTSVQTKVSQRIFNTWSNFMFTEAKISPKLAFPSNVCNQEPVSKPF